MKEAVIVSAARTPIGGFNGILSRLTAMELGSVALKASLERAQLKPEQVDEVIMGNVILAGEGQAPARQASLGAGLPISCGATTVNKMCGSGLKAVMMAEQAIKVGDAEIVLAGGMESMSRAPYLVEGARMGYRLGHRELADSLIKDGLWDVYNDCHMGACAEILAEEYAITREVQDDYAVQSYMRALAAQREGRFDREIVAVSVPQPKAEALEVAQDEEPARGKIDRFGDLKPAFKKDGTVTPANASSISDGAAALTVMSHEKAEELGKKPLCRILGQATAALAPEWFTIAPVEAVNKLLAKLSLRVEDIDLFEINEAFSAVAVACIEKLGIEVDKVNVNGGAVSLGHPIGASGARILTTLIHAMQARDARLGVASLCLAGGEAVALGVERI